jgi:hypothetical protein
MKIRNTFFAACAIFAFCKINAQEVATPAPILPSVTLGEGVSMKIGGFIRADAYYDTHLSEELLDGLLNLYPLNKQLDANNNDINAVSQYRMSAAASRLNSLFKGPDVFNAKTSSLIEFDFTGVNGIGARLRHAWIKLNWENSEMLLGRFWHPLFLLENAPNVLAINTGAPFAVFNRCEQLRFTYNLGSFRLMTAASSQMKYGMPNAAQYQMFPDLTINLQFKKDLFTLGVSGNIKNNRPNIVQIVGTQKFAFKRDVISYTAMGYATIKISDFTFKTSAIYGQNMHELLMLGGYASKSLDAINFPSYTTMNTMNLWANLIYGKELQFSVFAGYLKNLGAGSSTILNKSIVGRGADIDNLIRVAPCVSYKTGRTLFQLEVEQNIAAYGKQTINEAKTMIINSAKVSDSKAISNTRIQLATTFYF